MSKLNDRQRAIVARYIDEYPHLAELAEKAETDAEQLRTLGNAMSMVRWPAWATSRDAFEIARIGLPPEDEF